MSMPFIGEIRICSFNFPPKGWAFCNGQLLPINQNQALFSILGTTYGGDGRVNFALPDLRSRVPLHFGQNTGQNYVLGQRGGEENVTLNVQQMPAHNHTLRDNNQGANSTLPGNAVLAVAQNNLSLYASSPGSSQTLNGQSLTNSGGNQPHTNIQPYLTLNFIIALVGIFPTRN